MLGESKRKQSKLVSILDFLLSDGFFDDGKTPSEVIKRLSQKGLTIKGKKIGMVSRILTQICQDPSTGLEREEIPKERKRKGSNENWLFVRKIKKSHS